MAEILLPEPCPFCGGKAAKGLGKKIGCQLHGEPIQHVNIHCPHPKCPAKPCVWGGDLYNVGKEKAYEKAIIIWNTRFPAASVDSRTLDTAIRCLRTAVWRAEDGQQGYQMHPENLIRAKEVIASYEAGEKNS